MPNEVPLSVAKYYTLGLRRRFGSRLAEEACRHPVSHWDWFRDWRRTGAIIVQSMPDLWMAVLPEQLYGPGSRCGDAIIAAAS